MVTIDNIEAIQIIVDACRSGDNQGYDLEEKELKLLAKMYAQLEGHEQVAIVQLLGEYYNSEESNYWAMLGQYKKDFPDNRR